jgi:ATP-dependent RNA helicase SUPV3L1/SUV3
LEPYRRLLTLKEINTLCYSPVQLRDERSVAIFVNIVKAFSEQGQVHLEEIFGKTKLIETLKIVEDTLESLPPLPPIEGIGRRPLTPPILVSSIPQLEVLHKALVLYIWLSFRFDLSFLDRPHAMELKLRTEVVLDDCLERLPGLRNKKTHERGKEVDKSVRQWRREFVGPDGRRIELGKRKKGKEKRRQLSKMEKFGPSDEDEHGWVRDSGKEEVASAPDPDSIKWAGDRETSKRTKQGVWRNVAVLEQPSTETTSSSSSP